MVHLQGFRMEELREGRRRRGKVFLGLESALDFWANILAKHTLKERSVSSQRSRESGFIIMMQLWGNKRCLDYFCLNELEIPCFVPTLPKIPVGRRRPRRRSDGLLLLSAEQHVGEEERSGGDDKRVDLSCVELVRFLVSMTRAPASYFSGYGITPPLRLVMRTFRIDSTTRLDGSGSSRVDFTLLLLPLDRQKILFVLKRGFFGLWQV